AAAGVLAACLIAGWRIRLTSGGSASGASASPPLRRRARCTTFATSGKFPGTYGQARYGFAMGTASGGDLWLQNEAGVILHLKAKREGLMLSLGGDAVVISMRQ